MILFKTIKWKNFLSTGNQYTEVDFTKNPLGEIGKTVNQGHEYNSGTNTEWLLKEEFLKMVDDVDFS